MWLAGCVGGVDDGPADGTTDSGTTEVLPSLLDPIVFEGTAAANPSVRYVGSTLLTGWSDANRMWAGRVPASSPDTFLPTDLGPAGPGAPAPALGEAQNRVIAVWNDGSGDITVRTILESGELLDPLPIDSVGNAGEVGLGLAADGAGIAVYAAGNEFRVSAFDRENLVAEAPWPPGTLTDPNSLAVVDLGTQRAQTARVDLDGVTLLELDGDSVEIEALGAADPNSPLDLDVADGGASAVAWVDASELVLWVTGTERLTVHSAGDLDEVAVAWVGDEVAVVWSNGSQLWVRVVDPAAGRVGKALMVSDDTTDPGPPSASGRTVNGGSELVVGWAQDGDIHLRTVFIEQ